MQRNLTNKKKKTKILSPLSLIFIYFIFFPVYVIYFTQILHNQHTVYWSQNVICMCKGINNKNRYINKYKLGIGTAHNQLITGIIEKKTINNI